MFFSRGKMKKIRVIIQWIKCRIPLKQPPFGFTHGPIKVEKRLTNNSILIRCESCERRFVINNNSQTVMPWEVMKKHVKDFSLINKIEKKEAIEQYRNGKS